MDDNIVDILIKESGKQRRTVYRVLSELGLNEKKLIAGDLKNLVVIYLQIDGSSQRELRSSLKPQITNLIHPKDKGNFDVEFKNFLLAESKKKDKQLRKKEKQLNHYSAAVVNLSNKLIGLVDDISMLRVEEGSTIKRLHDKNVLADLLGDLDAGTPEHKAIEQLLKKLNG